MGRREDAKEKRVSVGRLREWLREARSAVERTLAVVRQVVGAPDYQRYLEHHARCHVGAAPLGPREFYSEFVSRRFGPGPTRCC